jgi:hypothetical protein
MRTILPGIVGLLLFASFVGLLAFRIGEWPLGIIIAAAVAMAAWDLIEEARASSER